MKKSIFEKGKRGLAWALAISMLLGNNPAGSMVMAGEEIAGIPEQLEYADWLSSGEDMIVDEMGGVTLTPEENKNQKYNVKVEYNETTGLVSDIILTRVVEEGKR